jgi:hypothetical protein
MNCSLLHSFKLPTCRQFGPDEFFDHTAIMAKTSECQCGGSLYYPWGRSRQCLRGALCFVGPYAITIRPGCYPLVGENHIRKPRQRILLSATIGTADDLSRRTGISGLRSLPIPARYGHAAPGKRLLIFPDNEAREKDMEKLAFETAAKLKKSVWLCSSSAEANNQSLRLRYRRARTKCRTSTTMEFLPPTAQGRLAFIGDVIHGGLPNMHCIAAASFSTVHPCA